MDFLLGVLDLSPETRWTPRQALQHPFITGGIFDVSRPPCRRPPAIQRHGFLGCLGAEPQTCRLGPKASSHCRPRNITAGRMSLSAEAWPPDSSRRSCSRASGGAPGGCLRRYVCSHEGAVCVVTGVWGGAAGPLPPAGGPSGAAHAGCQLQHCCAGGAGARGCILQRHPFLEHAGEPPLRRRRCRRLFARPCISGNGRPMFRTARSIAALGQLLYNPVLFFWSAGTEGLHIAVHQVPPHRSHTPAHSHAFAAQDRQCD